MQKFLGKKGFSGPIFLVDSVNGAPLKDDDGGSLYLTKRNGQQMTGFYSVRAEIDDDNFSAKITISGYKPEFLKGSTQTARTCFLLKRPPAINIVYYIDDREEVLDQNGNIVTPGTFSKYFAKDVVKTAGNCEQWKAIDFVLDLTGTLSFQSNFPVSFSSAEGFSPATITQSNINTANSVFL